MHQLPVKLKLANNQIFDQNGAITAIESDFNNTTGTIPFRATFSNPNSLLRHGQTGNILWPIPLENVLIIPQKCTFEVLDKKFVFVVDQHGKIRSSEITIKAELDYLYIIDAGLSENDHILLDGLRKVQNGDEIKYEFIEPSKVLKSLALHAE
jgi:membrane fusion protein (multidrug efflux system)